MRGLQTHKDKTFAFNVVAPGPWEHKEVPTLNTITKDIGDYVDSLKEDIMTDYAAAVKASSGKPEKLDHDKKDPKLLSPGNPANMRSEEGAFEAEDEVANSSELVKPGDEHELIRPKDQELDMVWQVC